jgi:serine/threonine protein kinase
MYKGTGYSFEVDLFAFGVLLFRLFSDERPFPIGNEEILKRRTIELRYQVNGEDWDLVSSLGKDMVRKLLINREQRLTAAQALRHPWMNDYSRSRLRMQGTMTRALGSRRSKSRNEVREQKINAGILYNTCLVNCSRHPSNAIP